MEHDVSLDTTGLLCPMPVMKASLKVKEIENGQVLEIVATDLGIKVDMPAWCKATGHDFLGSEEKGTEVRVYVRKTGP
ncbi:sulfurtransferase TusA family protein [candidate division KSB1 bacterium]